MGTLRDELISWASGLPDDATLDDVEYFLTVRRRVEAGLRDAEAGRVVPNGEAKRRVDEWLKSSGPVAR